MTIKDIPPALLLRVLHRRRKWLTVEHVMDMCAGVPAAKIAKAAGVHRQSIYEVRWQLGINAQA